MTEKSDLVFVYGTLRRGGSNHFRMADAGFVETGILRGRLYRVDWYPAMVLDSGGDEVSGEVFSVSPDLLARLDEFEGHEYRRIRATVKTPYGVPMKAWMWEWLMPVDESNRIASGDWLGENGV